MDVLASSEFRKVYAKLTTATTVTVNGHVIGTWTPTVPGAEVLPASAPLAGFSTRPFTPVPKPGKR